MSYQSDHPNYCLFACVISDICLVKEIDLLKPRFIFSKNLIL